MTREEAIQIIADLIDNPFLHTWEEQRKALNMAIEALQDDWIPVSERLPEEDGKYLAQCRTGSMDVLLWEDGWNCWRYMDGTVERDYEMKSITAWQPLPEPYKGE